MVFSRFINRLSGASLVVLAAATTTPVLAQSTESSPAAASGVAKTAPEAEIVVTGSRLANSGFNAPTPVTVIGAQDIARQAAPNISEVLNQVPAFRPQNTPATTAIFISNIGASTADLYGLGANRTLVLIDGRRVVASTTGGGSLTPANAVDLNLIPTSLIERSEVVTGGASAAYGSDAVAGVVNLVLKTKLEGLQGSVQYGQADAGDNKDYLGTLAFGTRLGDRGHFIVGGEWEKNRGTGDCYSRDWCAQAYNTVSNPNRTNGLPSQLVLPNTTTSTATRNGIITGTPAGFAAANPALFASTLTGLEFASNGSTFKHDYGTYYGAPLFQSGGGDGVQPFYENFPISSPMTRISTFAHANYDLTNSITATLEGSYARVHARTLGAQIRDLGSISIQRDNAFLPASVGALMDAAGASRISVGRIGDDLGPGVGEVHRETWRVVAGLKGDLGGSWKWNAYYQHGRTNYDQTQTNDRIGSRFTKAVDAVKVGNQIVCRVNADVSTTNDDPACQPLNIFGQNNFSAAGKAYAYGTATQETHLTQDVFSAQLNGNVFNTWAGPVSVAFGGEYRRDSAQGTADAISTANDFYTSPGAGISGKINVKEGFLEVGVPLARDLPFAQALDLNGAIRYTDYSVSGGVTSWKVGGTWKPVRQVTFRVTRSRDIRAPNVFELYGPNQSSFQLIADPTKGNVNFLTQTINRGSSALTPEKAETWVAGIVLQPDFWGLSRLRVSVDYYDIKLKGAIAALTAPVIVSQCAANPQSSVCSLITRDATTGNLVSVQNPLLNLNSLITQGWNMEASYVLPLADVVGGWDGSLSARVLATHINKLTTVTPSGVATNRAGQNGSPVSSVSGVPSWQMSGYLTYQGNRLGAQFQARYISPGVRDVTLIGPDQAGYSTTLANSTNNNHINAYWYFNINAQYDIIKSGSRSVQLFGAINNLFDKDPPVAPSSFGPTNNVLYDVIGRTYRVGVRFTY
ncbi:TonB-dependent receptor plug domain-containing protein [Sphingomonas sp. MMS24-J13]|uniref:TonB-dependent receptor plug domain-containing protein n=1 Tax=Sphingomonas sp. MMS24-J13 TaxID=3238686 RepID=UPI003850A126